MILLSVRLLLEYTLVGEAVGEAQLLGLKSLSSDQLSVLKWQAVRRLLSQRYSISAGLTGFSFTTELLINEKMTDTSTFSVYHSISAC